MSTKLYCGNLGYNISSSDLENLFAKYGVVHGAKVITDRETGRSKGFGFVEMSNNTAAQSAIAGLNNMEHEGHPITVNEARPRVNHNGGRRGGYINGRGRRY